MRGHACKHASLHAAAYRSGSADGLATACCADSAAPSPAANPAPSPHGCSLALPRLALLLRRGAKNYKALGVYLQRAVITTLLISALICVLWFNIEGLVRGGGRVLQHAGRRQMCCQSNTAGWQQAGVGFLCWRLPASACVGPA